MCVCVCLRTWVVCVFKHVHQDVQSAHMTLWHMALDLQRDVCVCVCVSNFYVGYASFEQEVERHWRRWLYMYIGYGAICARCSNRHLIDVPSVA